MRLLLIRHGRSAHAHAGALDRAGMERWLADYDAAGILDEDARPRRECGRPFLHQDTVIDHAPPAVRRPLS